MGCQLLARQRGKIPLPNQNTPFAGPITPNQDTPFAGPITPNQNTPFAGPITPNQNTPFAGPITPNQDEYQKPVQLKFTYYLGVS